MFEKRKREGNCFGCDLDKQIVNRTKWLCNSCNTSRLSQNKKDTEDIIVNCSKCNLTKPIVNQTYKLCDDCNYFRLHKESREETHKRKLSIQRIEVTKHKEKHPIDSLRYYQKRNVKVIEVPSDSSTQYKILFIDTKDSTYCNETELSRNKPLDKKENKKVESNSKQRREEAIQKQKLSSIKKEIEEEALEKDTYFCKGCDISYYGLDKSHILSVRYRKDLELDKNNINLLCRDCHVNWESGDIRKQLNLNCFEKDLKYIFEKDTPKFSMLICNIQQLQKEDPNFQKEKVQRILQEYC